jgi:hypothetical protein
MTRERVEDGRALRRDRASLQLLKLVDEICKPSNRRHGREEDISRASRL